MKKIIFIVLLFITLACNTKTVQKSKDVEPFLKTETLNKIENLNNLLKEEPLKEDTNNYIIFCDSLKSLNIELSKQLIKQNLIVDSLIKEPKTIIVDKSKKKFRNSFNNTEKNNNNSTEVIKMRNSMLIQADTIGQLHTDKNILGSKVKDLEKEITKNKNSTTGDNAPNTNKSGNTTKKAEWYLWVIVFLAGGLTALGIRTGITKTI